MADRKAHYVDYCLGVPDKDGNEQYVWKIGEVVNDKTEERVSYGGIEDDQTI